MILKQSTFISLTTDERSVVQPNLDYRQLKQANLKDMRPLSDNIDDKLINLEDERTLKYKEDFSEICKKSLLPIPGHVDYWDDQSSESYYPHSDWEGPSGNSWIQGDGYDK